MAHTASNDIVVPLTVLVNGITGRNPCIRLIPYSSVCTPSIVCEFPGFPNLCVLSKHELTITVNCSNQFALVVSFQLTVMFDRFTPVKSITPSVVLILCTFKKPDAAVLRFGV